MAALAAQTHKKSRNPKLYPGAKASHLRRYEEIINRRVAAGTGEMTLEDRTVKVTIRQFGDLSLLAHPQGESPRVLTRLEHKREALRILNEAPQPSTRHAAD